MPGGNYSYFIRKYTTVRGESSKGAEANVLECDIVVTKFKFQSQFSVHFRANIFGNGMNPFIRQAMGGIVPLLFFYKDLFGIKYPWRLIRH